MNVSGGFGDQSAEYKEMRSEIDAMREARERQQEMIKTIIKQRDMYRVLATTAGTGDGSGGKSSGSMLSPKGSGAETSTALVALSPMSPGQAEYAARAAEVENQLRKQVNDLERQLTRATEERNIMREVKERHESEATTAQAERNELRSEAERQKAEKAKTMALFWKRPQHL